MRELQLGEVIQRGDILRLANGVELPTFRVGMVITPCDIGSYLRPGSHKARNIRHYMPGETSLEANREKSIAAVELV